MPSTLIVRASVVQAIDGQNWTNGLCGTGRGVGRPIRPPIVWTNRADVAPISGSAWMSGSWTAGKRMAAGPTRTVVAPMWPWPR